MATIRRLSDADVRAIFESVHHNRPSPPHLQFHVVPVGPEGLRLSPPSYQFEDGLYILMKPQKKKAPPSEQPKVPPHLKNLVIAKTPPSSCPWSLSGPQFPQPTAIQQRYCYPKGDPHYSSRKGGALWTMYGADGKENLDYRLLHVYFSAKRAVNRGVKATGAGRNNKNNSNNTNKSRSLVQSTPKKKMKRTPPPTKVKSFIPPLSQSHHLSPPTTTTTRHCHSPLPFGEYTPPSPMTSPPMMYKGNFVSPNVFEDGNFHHSPFRPRALHIDDGSHCPPVVDHRHQLDQFQLDMDDHTTTPIMQELEDACWNDPLFPSQQQQQPQAATATAVAATSKPTVVSVVNGQQLDSLKNGLEKMHATVREKILAAPESEQGALVSLFASWARQVAQDPLNSETIAQV